MTEKKQYRILDIVAICFGFAIFVYVDFLSFPEDSQAEINEFQNPIKEIPDECKTVKLKADSFYDPFVKNQKKVSSSISESTRVQFEWAKKNKIAAVIEYNNIITEYKKAVAERQAIGEAIQSLGINRFKDREWTVAKAKEELAEEKYIKAGKKYNKVTIGWKKSPEGKKALAEEKKADIEYEKLEKERASLYLIRRM